VDPDFSYIFFSAFRAWGQAYGELLSAWCTLRRALARLEMAWQGDQAEDFLLEGNRLLSQLWDRGEELYRMGLDLCNTYKEIERLYTLL